MDDSKGIYSVIPDVWFDWYARFVPGLFGTSLYLMLSERDIFSLSAASMTIIVVLSYVFGTIIAPPSTMISKYFDNNFDSEEIYTDKKRAAKSENDHIPLRRISKGHAEAVCMLSCFIFLSIDFYIFRNSEKLNRTYMVLGMIYFIVFFFERTFARMRKIEDLVPSGKARSVK